MLAMAVANTTGITYGRCSSNMIFSGLIPENVAWRVNSRWRRPRAMERIRRASKGQPRHAISKRQVDGIEAVAQHEEEHQQDRQQGQRDEHVVDHHQDAGRPPPPMYPDTRPTVMEMTRLNAATMIPNPSVFRNAKVSCQNRSWPPRVGPRTSTPRTAAGRGTPRTAGRVRPARRRTGENRRRSAPGTRLRSRTPGCSAADPE